MWAAIASTNCQASVNSGTKQTSVLLPRPCSHFRGQYSIVEADFHTMAEISPMIATRITICAYVRTVDVEIKSLIMPGPKTINNRQAVSTNPYVCYDESPMFKVRLLKAPIVIVLIQHNANNRGLEIRFPVHLTFVSWLLRFALVLCQTRSKEEFTVRYMYVLAKAKWRGRLLVIEPSSTLVWFSPTRFSSHFVNVCLNGKESDLDGAWF